MGASKANCTVCGKPLLYFDEAQDVRCDVCGKPDTGRCICMDGHYVCDACHRERGVEAIMDACLRADERDPIALAQRIMADERIYPNGPEHHTLAGAVLLAAYRNAGGDVDLLHALSELRSRSIQVPGGSCGYWGCCGAAIGAGQFYSIAVGCTPLKRQEWADSARLVSDIMGAIADIGGPRCCKRTSFVALETAARHIERTTGVAMDVPERITCTFMSGNEQCLRANCPYFPAAD